MVTEEQIQEKLKTVIDPELQLDIVSMGLVYEVKIRRAGKSVFVLMTLTSPGCPLAGTFEKMVTEVVKQIEGVEEVEIELTWDPPWNVDMMSDEAKAEMGMF